MVLVYSHLLFHVACGKLQVARAHSSTRFQSRPQLTEGLLCDNVRLSTSSLRNSSCSLTIQIVYTGTFPMSTQSETLKCMAMRFTTDHVLVFTVGHLLDMLYCVMSVGRSVGYYGNAVSPIVPNRALHPKSHATQGSTAVTR
mmetsp:Transcript_18395/g.33345  ORF Transcript_18395/g.33345 Transcript_18395/m.33345 type:complete len:142 (-) Transcript_18395:227-652(-)